MNTINNWYIRPSTIHGKGAFAKKTFTPGEVVDIAFTKIGTTGIPATDFSRTKFCSFINHQQGGNIELFKKGRIYVARCIKTIHKNEEITCDYNKGHALDISGGWPPA